MTSQQLAKIERDLGEIVAGQRAILREMERDRQESKESRARLYKRVDEVESSAAISGKVAAQARDRVDALEKIVVEEVKPQTDRLKNFSLKVSGFFIGVALISSAVSAPLWNGITAAIQKLTQQ